MTNEELSKSAGMDSSADWYAICERNRTYTWNRAIERAAAVAFNYAIAAEKEQDGRLDGACCVNTAEQIAAEIRKLAIDSPQIDHISTPPELCGHAEYCRKLNARIPGWRHCNEACPQLSITQSDFECTYCKERDIRVTGPHSHTCSVCGQHAEYGWYTTPLCWVCRRVAR